MTEYDFSPEAYEHHMAKLNGVSRWVNDTERYRPQFVSGAELIPPVPQTAPTFVYRSGMDDYLGSAKKPYARDRPGYYNVHRRYSSVNYPPNRYIPSPVSPPYPHIPNTLGFTVPGHVPVPPPPSYPVVPPHLMVVSPPSSQRSQRSRRSHRTRRSSASATTYLIAPPPPPPNSTPYYSYSYPYAPAPAPGYAYIGPAGPGQPAVLSAPAGSPTQSMPYYNPHPSQPLRAPPYPQGVNPGIDPMKPHHTGQGPALTYSYSAPKPFAINPGTPPVPAGAAPQYVLPHDLYQRLSEIGRRNDRRRSRSTSSSDRGRSVSRGDRGRSRSRGRSRTRKSWWNFT